MSESYQKLRKDFKELDFTDRLTFLAESVLLTGQSAVVGGLNLAGNIFDTVTGTVGAVIDASGIGNLLGSTGVVGETIDRVAITVKDASRTANELYASAVETVENELEMQRLLLVMQEYLLLKLSRILPDLFRRAQ